MSGDLFIQADPPPKYGASQRGEMHDFAAHCKANPGVWFQYKPGQAHSGGVASYMRRRHGLTVTTRHRDGKFDVYARWDGEVTQ